MRDDPSIPLIHRRFIPRKRFRRALVWMSGKIFLPVRQEHGLQIHVNFCHRLLKDQVPFWRTSSALPACAPCMLAEISSVSRRPDLPRTTEEAAILPMCGLRTLWTLLTPPRRQCAMKRPPAGYPVGGLPVAAIFRRSLRRGSVRRRDCAAGRNCAPLPCGAG